MLVFPFSGTHATTKYVIYGTALFLAGAIYLLLRGRMHKIGVVSDLHARPPKLNIFVFFSFVSLFLSVATLFSGVYYRPPSFFVLLIVSAGLIVTQILLYSEKKYEKIILFQILLIGLILSAGLYFSYPSAVGIDPFFHIELAGSILKTGQIPVSFDTTPVGYSSYSNFPIFHILIAETSHLTALDLKTAAWTSVALIEIISLLFVFFLGRTLIHSKAALIATLIGATASWHIQWSYWIIPMTIGLAVMPIFVWLLLSRNNNSRSLVGLSIILLSVVVMTHGMSSFVLLILVSSFLVSDKFLKKVSHANFPSSRTLTIFFLLCLSIVLGYWLYASSYIDYVGQSISSFFVSRTLIHTQLLFTGLESLWPEDVGLYFFAIIGILLFSSDRFRQKNSFRLVFGCTVITLVALFSNALNLSAIVPERWLSFSQILLLVPAAMGFAAITNLLGKNKKILFSVIVICFLFVFPMIASLQDDFANPFQNPDTQFRFALSKSELTAASTIMKFNNETIMTDSFYSLEFTYNNNLNFGLNPVVNKITLSDLRNNFSETHGNILILREYCIKNTMYFSTSSETGITRIDPSVQNNLDVKSTFNRVYSSSTVTAYLPTNK